MKKLITSFMVLLFLIGSGTKSYGQAAGDYVFTQATDTLWATVGNWSVSDGAGNLTVATATPTATTNVWIPTGKRMGTVAGATTATGAISLGSATLNLTVAPTANIVGLAIRNKTSGINGSNYGIAQGTYVTAVNGAVVTLSQPATSTNSSLSFELYPSCKNLNVTGFIRVTAALVVFGDITVNTGGILTQGSDLYCANINNFGTFNSNAGYRSCKNLYVGYNGAVPGTGDYAITNDGLFGDTTPKVPQGNTSGISVLYSNQANSFTIKPSSSSISTYAFNVGQIVPTNYIKTLANTTLYIKESMSLLKSSGISFSIQNNDSSENTIRTCNVDPGVTVYLGCNFHANRAVTTYPQGSFKYNVFGVLDLGSYASVNNNTTAAAAQTVSLSLCMTTIQGNTGTLTFNLGDGTQGNAGTLILGNNMQMIKQRTQTIALNLKDYSTVKVKGNYGWIMNYQLLNSNTPAPYLFPTKFYNLSVDSAKYVLPAKSIVKGIYTAPTGRAAFANWAASTGLTTTANSLYNSSATSPLPQGSIVYTGTNYYYVPVVRTTSSYSSGINPITLAGDTILNYIQPAQLASGSNLSSAVTSLTGTSLQLVTAPTPTNPVTNGFVQFYAIQGTTAPTGTSINNYSPVFDGTQALIYLGTSDFTAPVITPNAVATPNTENILVYIAERNQLVISNAIAGDIATVYSVTGSKVASAKLTSDKATISIARGIYLVKVNNSVTKVIVR